MKINNSKSKNIITIGLLLLFVVSFVGSVVSFWFDGINKWLNVDQFGTPIEVSNFLLIISLIFIFSLLALTVVGFIFKNKTLLYTVFGYQMLFIISVILLVFFVGGQVDNPTLYNILMWALFILLAPVFGVTWIFGTWSIGIFIVLIILNTIALVSVSKSR